MSKQGRHHYIPIFYLKQWAGDDGRICEFSRPHDRVKPRKVHPAGTAYMDGLNTVTGLPLAEQQYLEDVFYKASDDDAARALHILLIPPPWKISVKERSGWSRFIISLMLRHPEAVQKHTKVAVELFREALPRIEALYAKERGPNDPLTYGEHAQIHAPHPEGRTIVRLLQGIVDNEELGRKLNSMRWMVLEERNPTFQLLTSDRPLLVTNGIGRPDGHIIMPISPFHIFVATNNIKTENNIRTAWKMRALISQINNRVACQSRKYVYGRDDAQLSFVSKRLGKKYTADPLEHLTHQQLKDLLKPRQD